MFTLLVRGWVKPIEDGTVDWDDLIERLEAAVDRAKERRTQA